MFGTVAAMTVLTLAFGATAPAQVPVPISSMAALQRIGNDPGYPLDAHYQLTGDLDAAETASWNDGAGFAPIGTPEAPFIGSFDGNGFTIRDLYIDRPDEDMVGLFGDVGEFGTGAVGGEIIALTLEDAFVRGNDYVGTLVGRFRGKLEECRVTGAVVGDRRVGGMIGNSRRGSSLQQLEAVVDVTGRLFVGGLVGDGWSSRDGAENCSAHGDVTGGWQVGGLVGYARDDWKNSHATGRVRGETEIGGLMGRLAGGSAQSCYAYGDVEGTGAYTGGLLGVGEQTILIDSHAYGTVIGLGNVGGLVGAHKAFSKGGSSAARDCSAHGKVIGTGGVGGLIGSLTGGVSNSYATGDVFGREDVGGGIGRVNGRSRVSNAHATGTVRGTNSVGGFTGRFVEGLLQNVYATGAVFGDTRVGGLVGTIPHYRRQPCLYCANWGPPIPRPEVTQSRAFGPVAGRNQVGGLVGAMVSGYLTASHASGAVSGDTRVGGLVGEFIGDRVRDSYALGTVAGVEQVGGLIGRHDAGRVLYCYAAGRVVGTDAVGGLIGEAAIPPVPEPPPPGQWGPGPPPPLLVGNFWDVDSSGQSDSGGGVGLPTEAMLRKATFLEADWDFEEVWDIREGLSYPMHRDQPSALAPVPAWVCGHTADLGGDCRLELPELMRLIQLFNAGGYHCAPPGNSTEDGYAIGAKAEARNCMPHSSDYNPQDWRIDLSELLRMIQFYVVSGYHACPDADPPSEDGFCPGPLQQ